MISEQIKKNTKLYKFLKVRRGPGRPVRFDEDIWFEALDRLSYFNRSDYYFDFEDRLVEEIVLSVLRYPNETAKAEMIRIKSIVDKKIDHAEHSRTFVRSMRNSIAGAVSVALKCL